MIGFILGTSEGKKILEQINHYTNKVVVSTATVYGGEILDKYDIHYINTKPLNKEELKEFLLKFNVKVLVDCSHPYAEEVSKNAQACCEEMNIEYIRYERKGILQDISHENIIKIQGYSQLEKVLNNIDGTVLNTTGSKNIKEFMRLNVNNRIVHRILPTVNSLKETLDNGVKIDDVVAIKGPIGYELNRAFIKEYDGKVIVTKDSGIEGGAKEKLDACMAENIKLVIIEKPKIEYGQMFHDINYVIKYLVSNYLIT